MFDFDISKMALIGTVALVVLGPERLPRVARTVGTLLGRAQRYMNAVRTEVDQQIQIEDLRKLKDDIEHEVAAVHSSVQHTVRQHAADLQAGVDEAAASLQELVPASYLPSVHEAGGELQAELFKIRTTPAQVPWPAPMAPRTSHPYAVAPPQLAAQPGRTRWRAAASGSRAVAAKRGRVVSVAARKALGRAGA